MSTEETYKPKKTSNSYNIFILVLTVMSLVIMAVQLLPLPASNLGFAWIYDNVICFIFLYDFFSSLFAAPKKSDYFLRGGGWLDLLGSIPSFGLTTFGGLLRLFRLSRLARITRLMRGENKKQLVNDVLTHRSQYAGFITILLVFIVLVISSVLVFNSKVYHRMRVSPQAGTRSGIPL